MNALLLTAAAFAQEKLPGGGTPTAAPGAGTGPGGGLPQLVITIGMLILIFYFIILRPQKAEQRKREELLNAVAKGDQVITSGGILGTVEGVDVTKGIVTLTIAPKVSIKCTRAAISSVIKKKDAKEAEGESAT